VGGITGAKTKAKLGAAEQVRIGRVAVHNVVFNPIIEGRFRGRKR